MSKVLSSCNGLALEQPQVCAIYAPKVYYTTRLERGYITQLGVLIHLSIRVYCTEPQE